MAVAAPAPIITATSSQIVARNHNGIAFAPVVAPAPIAHIAPVAPLAAPASLVTRYAAAPFAYPAHLASYAAPAVPAAFSYAPAYAPTLRYAAAAPAQVVW